MSYIIEQKVGKHTYLYEAESYWDRVKGGPRQKRKYLGKKDPNTGKIIKTSKGYASYDYGGVYFLDKIAKKIGLERIVKKYFPQLCQQILVLTYFLILEAKPLYLAGPWLEATYFKSKPNLSSQRISDITKKLGEDEGARMTFLKAWAKKHKDTNFIIFDITSISSYSKKLNLVEWGYNRDRESLAQINFGLVYGEPSRLPLIYTRYPGSIPDVTTLKNLISHLEWVGFKNCLFVLDKGFYSRHNLDRFEDMAIVIPIPYSRKAAKEFLSRHRESLGLSQNAFLLEGRVLYCIRDSVNIGDKNYYGYLYLDERRRAEERDIFLKKVFEVEKSVKSLEPTEKDKVVEFLEDNVDGWKNIFEIIGRDRPSLKRKNKAIEKSLFRMGTTILISNKKMAPQYALSLYRRKDRVEKFFDSLKNEMNIKRLRASNPAALEGRLFLYFIALILYAHMAKVQSKEGITKDLSIQEIAYSLKKIKLIQLGEKKTVITEVSKKQRDLFKNFGIDTP